MNTFWLKIAGVAVAVVVAIVVVSMYLPHGPREPQPPEKTFYDQAQQDKEKFLAEPKPLENQQQPQAPPPQPTENKTEVAPPAQPAVEPPKPSGPTVIYCKPLSEIDDIEAQRLLNVAVPGRSIGRLPMTGFKLMVDTSRQIIQRWPDSWYAYRAKQMLADMPERWRRNYKITEEELDVSRFAQPMPGTQPFTVKVEESR